MSADMYLDLLKQTLTGMVYKDPAIPVPWRQNYEYNFDFRYTGRDWPQHAQTMIGMRRLNNLQTCMKIVLEEGIPGDFIETGVWRGGACIFMRGYLKVYNVTDRMVWVADSFQGFPRNLISEGDRALASQPEQQHLAVPMKEVIDNFSRYGLCDARVGFIPGWFNETLPGPVDKLAILRLDGDLYASTMDVLNALYPKLEMGGCCIIDDWNVPMCRQAVEEYRAKHNIYGIIYDIDGHSIFWRRED